MRIRATIEFNASSLNEERDAIEDYFIDQNVDIVSIDEIGPDVEEEEIDDEDEQETSA